MKYVPTIKNNLVISKINKKGAKSLRITQVSRGA